jgi:hypothetical protein
MSKHTPGPWKHKADRLEIWDGNNLPIADVRCFRVADDAINANAALIAASPELLAIAKAYRNLLRTAAHTDGEVATFHHIESVIARAEGNES